MSKESKKEESKLKRISENADNEKFVELGRLIQEGKAKIVYYGAEGNVGYFYYQLID